MEAFAPLVTRRQCLAFALHGGLGIMVLTLSGAGCGASTKPDAGIDSWLARRLIPDGDPEERALLSRIVAGRLETGGELALVDAALRQGRIASPFEYPSTDSLQTALMLALGAFLRESDRLQRRLGLPDGFGLDAVCGLAPANVDVPPAKARDGRAPH
jgi:hypothetical protein